MYVTSLFQVLPHGVSKEAIQEVETLPSATVTKEEHFLFQTQQRYSQQVRETHTQSLQRYVVIIMHGTIISGATFA